METLTTNYKVFDEKPTHSNAIFCRAVNKIITHDTEENTWSEDDKFSVEVNSEGELLINKGNQWIYVKGIKNLNLLSEAIEIARKNNIETPEVQVFEK